MIGAARHRAAAWSRPVTTVGIVLGTAAWGCRGTPPVVAPQPVDMVDETMLRPLDPTPWITDHRPGRALRYELRWQLHESGSRHGGRATVWYAPPDSLRLEYQGPLGRSGTAVIVADRVVWAKPRRGMDRLVRAPLLVWAALGIPRPPSADARVSQGVTPAGQVWRFVTTDTTLTYMVRPGSPQVMLAGLATRARTIGSSSVTLSDSTGLPTEGQLWLDGGRTMLKFTVRVIEPPGDSTPEIGRGLSTR